LQCLVAKDCKRLSHFNCYGRQTALTLKRRLAWFAGQPDLDPRKLVFIYETGASTNLARKGRRCRRGRRLRAAIPHGHYKTITLVAGLRLRGHEARKVFDRPINGALFEEWVEQCLAPTLSAGEMSSSWTICPPIKGRVSRSSKLKAYLRKIAERTVAGLMRALENCADIFKPAECANYFDACGYDTT
jgi:transposase